MLHIYLCVQRTVLRSFQCKHLPIAQTLTIVVDIWIFMRPQRTCRFAHNYPQLHVSDNGLWRHSHSQVVVASSSSIFYFLIVFGSARKRIYLNIFLSIASRIINAIFFHLLFFLVVIFSVLSERSTNRTSRVILVFVSERWNTCCWN